jgi:hypothetical protein
MRLLNTSTLVVEEFFSNPPEYVILSHTWEQEEVTLQDMISGCASGKKAYAKITGCCKQALNDGFGYCWIDTCCIDKTSSAELSEAINSMYKWYEGSCICYVYLSDVDKDSEKGVLRSSFDLSRWFTRGWTLQELIAPAVVVFYDGKWRELGTKLSLQSVIANITGIDITVLEGQPPRSCNVATRMSWASYRKTTRVEDASYCLLGLFGVSMPLLYGEGHKAFGRLQEEILKIEEDYTLFTWSGAGPLNSMWKGDLSDGGLLAQRPSSFADFLAKHGAHRQNQSNLCNDPSTLFPKSSDHPPPYLTSRGLRISLPLMPTQESSEFWACLTLVSSGHMDHGASDMFCIMLRLCKESKDSYTRPLSLHPQTLPASWSKNFRRELIYVVQPHDQAPVVRFTTGNSVEHVPVEHLPCLVILHASTNKDERLEYCSSRMLSLDAILAAPHNPSEPAHGSSPRWLPSVTKRLSSLSKEEMDRLTMNANTRSCHLVDPEGYICFTFRVANSPLAFAVRLDVARNYPCCQIWKISSTEFGLIETDAAKFEELFCHLSSTRADYVRVRVDVEDHPVIGRAKARIRRIATGELRLTRYILSIDVELEDRNLSIRLHSFPGVTTSIVPRKTLR